MFDFKLARESGPAVLQLNGEIVGHEDFDVLKEAFALIPPDDHLILDLRDVSCADAGAADLLHDVLIRRAAIAESVVVSSHEDVSMQLVLHDIDRVCPIVSKMADATEIIDRPWANRRQPH
jgi:hypothetical protein